MTNLFSFDNDSMREALLSTPLIKDEELGDREGKRLAQGYSARNGEGRNVNLAISLQSVPLRTTG